MKISDKLRQCRRWVGEALEITGPERDRDVEQAATYLEALVDNLDVLIGNFADTLDEEENSLVREGAPLRTISPSAPETA